MPIARHKPTAPSIVKTNLPKIESSNYKSVIVDDNETPLKSLLAYVEGAPWTVNYYSQIISEHNDIKDFDPTQTNIYQQYSKINDLEIRVSTALNSSQDTENSLLTVSGSGLIYPFLVPNVGDLFTSSAGQSREGLYRVSNVERKTFNRDSVFSIDYELVGYTDEEKTFFSNLESKVTRVLFFNKDRLIDGGVPTLSTEENTNYINLSSEYKKICFEYFKTFFNKEIGTLILPGQNNIIYDSFLVDFVMKIVDTFDAEEIRYVKKLTTENNPFLKQKQFWNLLEERDIEILPYLNKNMVLASTKIFNKEPMLQGLLYSRVEYIVYPENGDLSVFSGKDKISFNRDEESANLNLSTISEASTSGGSIADILNKEHIEQNCSLPIIYNVLKDKSYVLSENFYNKTNNRSLLEILVYDYIKGNSLNIKNLSEVVSSRHKWGRLEQFYYGPILLVLIKTMKKGLY